METERIEIKVDNKKNYDIVIADDYSSLKEELLKIFGEGKKALVFTDSNVRPLYEETVRDALSGVFKELQFFSYEAGECSKNLKTVNDAYGFLIDNRFGRKDVILALGGGVAGDMAGFTAATYLRGIDYVQLPTTLLSMVDSGIGGKTGVDYESYKNMVGAFYMPRLVYINTETLNTLPDRQYSSGIAEVLKAGLIKDPGFYEWMINSFNEIGDKEPSYISEMIFRSLCIKKAVVEKDPFEHGDRALLNFGHTLGHAIEKFYDFKYMHGECVALGSVCAAFISYKRGLISAEEYYEIRDMFVPFGLPISITGADADVIVSYTASDKKNDTDHLKFILLKKIGRAYIDITVTEEEMKAAVNELIFTEGE
ncbi:MAG: 3-dehydroquinate synthase [Lachnospiraceae bacterium]|nr:3-dehydroquinate synthase [Lachnospiraceae bacterium]